MCEWNPINKTIFDFVRSILRSFYRWKSKQQSKHVRMRCSVQISTQILPVAHWKLPRNRRHFHSKCVQMVQFSFFLGRLFKCLVFFLVDHLPPPICGSPFQVINFVSVEMLKVESRHRPKIYYVHGFDWANAKSVCVYLRVLSYVAWIKLLAWLVKYLLFILITRRPTKKKLPTQKRPFNEAPSTELHIRIHKLGDFAE